MTRLFVEQPLASPGSAKHCTLLMNNQWLCKLLVVLEKSMPNSMQFLSHTQKHRTVDILHKKSVNFVLSLKKIQFFWLIYILLVDTIICVKSSLYQTKHIFFHLCCYYTNWILGCKSVVFNYVWLYNISWQKDKHKIRNILYICMMCWHFFYMSFLVRFYL